MPHPLLAWFAANHPRAAETLRPPATEETIAEARLPAAFAAMYREHDGQDDGPMVTSFFDEAMHWLPLAESARQREMFTEVLEGVRAEFPEQEPSSPAWFPFAGDHLGNVMIVDVERDEVFYFDHAEGCDEREVRPSSEAFLARYLAQLESSTRVLDPKLGVVDPTLPSAPLPPAPVRRGALLVIGLAVLAIIAVVIWLGPHY